LVGFDANVSKRVFARPANGSVFWSKVDHVCRVKAVCHRTLVDDFEGSVGIHLYRSPHEVFSTRKFDFYPTTNCVN
jgi:hypothetical protein